MKSQVTVTRPANTTAYTAGDVVGGVIAFPGMAYQVGGAEGLLTSCDLRIDVAAVPTGMTSFRLHLYNAQPAALADNAVWVLAAADRSIYVGYVDLGSPAAMGATNPVTLFTQADGINKHYKCGVSDTTLYGYLVTNGGFTPAANSEVYTPCLRAVAV